MAEVLLGTIQYRGKGEEVIPVISITQDQTLNVNDNLKIVGPNTDVRCKVNSINGSGTATAGQGDLADIGLPKTGSQVYKLT